MLVDLIAAIILSGEYKS